MLLLAYVVFNVGWIVVTGLETVEAEVDVAEKKKMNKLAEYFFSQFPYMAR